MEGPMTPEEFNRTILGRLEAEPFRPFVVEFLDGRRLTFDKPSLAIRGGAAGGFDRGGELILLDSDEVARVVDDAPTETSLTRG
jgi:hypothetical protein